LSKRVLRLVPSWGLLVLGGLTSAVHLLAQESGSLSSERQWLERNLTLAAQGPQFVLMALAVAFFLGAAHGLTPGHGKTLVAAYLVGSRGTIRDAVYLGSVVTVTHTSSVFLLGFLTLFASRYIMMDRIYPWLSVTSGLLVVGMGLWLLRKRLSRSDSEAAHLHTHVHSHEHGNSHEHSHEHTHTHGSKHSHEREHGHSPEQGDPGEHSHEHLHGHSHQHAHEHAHQHEHSDQHVHSHTEHSHTEHSHAEHSHAEHSHAEHSHAEHSHAEHSHEHGEHPHVHVHGQPTVIEHDGHTHVIPAPGVSRWELLSLGVSGGMVPCPEALVVLLMAVSLHRLALGLVILTAFSLGLAAVLIAIGVALILSGPLMSRLSPGGWVSRFLPVGSAVVVTILGIGIVFRALIDTRLIRF